MIEWGTRSGSTYILHQPRTFSIVTPLFCLTFCAQKKRYQHRGGVVHVHAEIGEHRVGVLKQRDTQSNTASRNSTIPALDYARQRHACIQPHLRPNTTTRRQHPPYPQRILQTVRLSPLGLLQPLHPLHKQPHRHRPNQSTQQNRPRND